MPICHIFIFYELRLKVIGGKDGTTENLFKASISRSVYNKVFKKNMDKNSLRTDVDEVVTMVKSELDTAFFSSPLNIRDKQIFCKVSSSEDKKHWQ